MFGAVLTAIGTLLQLYVLVRACSVPFLRRRLGLKALIVVGAATWLVFVAGRLLGHGRDGAASVAFELAGMTWLGWLLLASVCLFAVEIITVFGLVLRKIAPVLRGWALLAGACLSIVAMVQGMRPPTVESYEVVLPNLPRELDGTVVAAMSDLHLGSLLGEKWLAARVAQVQALHPDMVVLLGDVIEGHGRPADELLAGLGGLSAPLGVWAVPGNHESWATRDGSSPLAGQPSIEMLQNRCVEVRPGLVLAGVEDLTAAGRAGRDGGLVEAALAGRGEGATILLSHTPLQTEEAAKRGVSLMVCGHTHGGQIWPMGYLTGMRYPLLAGRYDVGRMTVLVCRGTGTWGPRMRLWRPAEIMRITLRAKAE